MSPHVSPSQLASVVSRSPQSIIYPVGKERASFNTVAVTPFQWSVYDIVKQVRLKCGHISGTLIDPTSTQIPPGSLSTYGDIAKHLDTSPRAVGNALRRNPFCPLVPCHHVVASSGALGGFFGE